MRARETYNAFMRLFTGMSTHVDDQHVLRLEGPRSTNAVSPETDEALLVSWYMLIGDMLEERKITEVKS